MPCGGFVRACAASRGALRPSYSVVGWPQGSLDDAYIRDFLLQPDRDIAAGYENIMPTFKNVLDEGEVLALTAYLRSLGAGD